VEVVLWQMAGGAIRDELVLSGPDAAARGGLTGLLARSSTVDVRPDATSMVVRARFMRASGANTYNDAYADNISLRISEVGATPPEPPCSPEAPTDPGDPQPPAPK